MDHHRRCAFYEFSDVYSMQSDFEAILEAEFNAMIANAAANANGQ